MKFLSIPRLAGCAVLLSWLLPAAVHARDDFQWEPLRIGGRDYLSVDQICRFYELNVRREGEKIILDDGKRVSIELAAGSPVCRMNGLKFVFELPVMEADAAAQVSRSDLNGVLDPVLRPAIGESRGRLETVILDPDHGGGEEDSALLIAKQSAEELTKAGYKVVFTRDEEAAVTPGKLLDLANAVEDNAVFIRIHFGDTDDEARGIQTTPLFIPGDAPAAGTPGRGSMALAAAIHGSVASILGKHLIDLGIQRVIEPDLSKLKHPAVFVDVGCRADPEDAKLLRNEAYRKSLARAIVSGVRKYKIATKQ
jgi:N-acetylmuramoyl-L-alanine amidase